MKTARLTGLPVKHLDYVFSPPGLPLPAKGEGDLGTTSILVRGGAGTGKTTFALALAHAVAKTNGGLVLYLTTEFSPVEITFKATLIGLPEEAVDVWPGRDDMTPGGVAVENLSEVRQGRPVLSSAERRRSSIDAVWGLLHPQKEGAARPALPVRSVVIDALTLPELGENDGAQRADLVAFVQALENEGVSVVLVEELAPGAAAWSSFVVDVVFELSFQPDPETQDLRRKLTLSKCRYAMSIPGPHDYGLEDGVPAVWPDLFRVVTISHGSTKTPLFQATPLQLMVPLGEKETWVQLHKCVILSPNDKTHATALYALMRTPDAIELTIRCGARTLISALSHHCSVNEDDGVHAIGWMALSCAKLAGANLCFFYDLERLLSRPDSATRVNRLLEALSLMGFTVCVHSPHGTLRQLDATADYTWDGRKSKPLILQPRRHRAFARRSIRMPWMKESSVAASRLSKIELALNLQILQAARTAVDIEVASATSPLEQLQLATVQELSGSRIDSERLSSQTQAGRLEAQQAAWLALHTGDYWHAGRAARAAVETHEPAPTMLLLWASICAAVAWNFAAIDELKERVASPDEALILDPLLRGLARTGQLDEADRIIADVGARHALAPWMLDRLCADTRLDANSSAALHNAAERLTTLTANESLPLVHRAEIWHNLGTAQDRLGQRDAAIGSFTRAAELNPFLDAAREELERLQASKLAPT